MGDCNYLNAIVCDSIDQLERKPVEEVAPRAVQEERPSFRRIGNGFNPAIKFV